MSSIKFMRTRVIGCHDKYKRRLCMTSKKNNYISKYFGLFVLLYSLSVESEDFNYQFNWLFVPVAKLSINFNESLLTEKLDLSNVNFHLSTLGPLKLYRDYLTDGYIENNYSDSWNYHLLGRDRGQPEEKLIIYFNNKPPIIKKFIDDTNVLPLNVDTNLDRGAIDPFSVLLRTIEHIDSYEKCDKTYHVMDGKRRYEIRLEFIDKEYLYVRKKTIKEETFHCRLSIPNNKYKDIDLKRNQWPFNGGNKIIDIWFSANMEYIPVQFRVKTPIGKITGKLMSK